MLTCIPDLLTRAELRQLREVIDTGAFQDGAATAGFRAKRVKQNLQLDKASDGMEQARKTLMAAIKRHPEFQRAALPRTIRPPLISRYEPGMEYGLHVDDALMGPGKRERSDLSMTIFLNDPGDYDGGELLCEGGMGPQEIKLPAGAAVLYPSSTLHRVAPVTRGQRLAAVTWVQSFVRDPTRREVLYDLDRIRQHLHETAPAAEETDLAFKTHANLLRMWSET